MTNPTFRYPMKSVSFPPSNLDLDFVISLFIVRHQPRELDPTSEHLKQNHDRSHVTSNINHTISKYLTAESEILETSLSSVPYIIPISKGPLTKKLVFCSWLSRARVVLRFHFSLTSLSDSRFVTTLFSLDDLQHSVFF